MEDLFPRTPQRHSNFKPVLKFSRHDRLGTSSGLYRKDFNFDNENDGMDGLEVGGSDTLHPTPSSNPLRIPHLNRLSTPTTFQSQPFQQENGYTTQPAQLERNQKLLDRQFFSTRDRDQAYNSLSRNHSPVGINNQNLINSVMSGQESISNFNGTPARRKQQQTNSLSSSKKRKRDYGSDYVIDTPRRSNSERHSAPGAHLLGDSPLNPHYIGEDEVREFRKTFDNKSEDSWMEGVGFSVLGENDLSRSQQSHQSSFLGHSEHVASKRQESFAPAFMPYRSQDARSEVPYTPPRQRDRSPETLYGLKEDMDGPMFGLSGPSKSIHSFGLNAPIRRGRSTQKKQIAEVIYLSDSSPERTMAPPVSSRKKQNQNKFQVISLIDSPEQLPRIKKEIAHTPSSWDMISFQRNQSISKDNNRKLSRYDHSSTNLNTPPKFQPIPMRDRFTPATKTPGWYSRTRTFKTPEAPAAKKRKVKATKGLTNSELGLQHTAIGKEIKAAKEDPERELFDNVGEDEDKEAAQLEKLCVESQRLQEERAAEAFAKEETEKTAELERERIQEEEAEWLRIEKEVDEEMRKKQIEEERVKQKIVDALELEEHRRKVQQKIEVDQKQQAAEAEAREKEKQIAIEKAANLQAKAEDFAKLNATQEEAKTQAASLSAKETLSEQTSEVPTEDTIFHLDNLEDDDDDTNSLFLPDGPVKNSKNNNNIEGPRSRSSSPGLFVRSTDASPVAVRQAASQEDQVEVTQQISDQLWAEFDAAKDMEEKAQEAKIQAEKDQAVREQVAKDQAAKDRAVNNQAAKDQAEKDRAAKAQAMREETAKIQESQQSAQQQKLAQPTEPYLPPSTNARPNLLTTAGNNHSKPKVQLEAQTNGENNNSIEITFRDANPMVSDLQLADLSSLSLSQPKLPSSSLPSINPTPVRLPPTNLSPKTPVHSSPPLSNNIYSIPVSTNQPSSPVKLKHTLKVLTTSELESLEKETREKLAKEKAELRRIRLEKSRAESKIKMDKAAREKKTQELLNTAAEKGVSLSEAELSAKVEEFMKKREESNSRRRDRDRRGSKSAHGRRETSPTNRSSAPIIQLAPTRSFMFEEDIIDYDTTNLTHEQLLRRDELRRNAQREASSKNLAFRRASAIKHVSQLQLDDSRQSESSEESEEDPDDEPMTKTVRFADNQTPATTRLSANQKATMVGGSTLQTTTTEQGVFEGEISSSDESDSDPDEKEDTSTPQQTLPRIVNMYPTPTTSASSSFESIQDQPPVSSNMETTNTSFEGHDAVDPDNLVLIYEVKMDRILPDQEPQTFLIDNFTSIAAANACVHEQAEHYQRQVATKRILKETYDTGHLYAQLDHAPPSLGQTTFYINSVPKASSILAPEVLANLPKRLPATSFAVIVANTQVYSTVEDPEARVYTSEPEFHEFYSEYGMANMAACVLLTQITKPTTPKIDWVTEHERYARMWRETRAEDDAKGELFNMEVVKREKSFEWLAVEKVRVMVKLVEMKGPLN